MKFDDLWWRARNIAASSRRLEEVVEEASAEPKPILFIDEIHLLLGVGSAGGSMPESFTKPGNPVSSPP